jgi:exonuclease SbcC
VRPLELTIQGFRSYKESQTFGFEERGLFGIVGPTGSGKSSILDAVIFALYGRAPHNDRGTKQLINSSSDEATVQLAFKIDDRAWQVTRVLRRKGNPPVVLKRIAEDEIEEQGARAVSERIQGLIGLDFDGFCSSVTLPQGEFDRFLSAAPAERTKVLKGIFRLERIDALRDLARAKLSEIAGRVSGLETQLASLPEDPEALIAGLKESVGEVEALAKEIKAAIPQETKARQAIEAVEAKTKETLAEIEAINAGISQIPETKSLETLAGQEDAAKTAIKKAGEVLKAADAALAKSESSLKALEESYPRSELQELRQSVRESERLRGRLEVLAKDRTKHEKETKTTSEAAKTAAKKLKLADDSLSKARDAHELAVHSYAAHGLRTSLSDGDNCPVCDQPVAKVPAAGTEPGLDAAKEAVTKAEDALRKVQQEAKDFEQSAAIAAERLKASKEEEKSLGKELSAAQAFLSKRFGKQDPSTKLKEIEDQHDELTSSVESARGSVEEARSNEAVAKKAAETLTEQRLSLVQALIRVSDRLSVDAPSFDDDASALMGFAKEATDAARERVDVLRKEIDRLAVSAGEARTFIEEFSLRFDLKAGEEGHDGLARVNEHLGSLKGDLKRAEEAIQVRKKIESETEGLWTRKRHLEQLSADLADSKFPAYLLGKQRRLLSSLGSEKLMALTSRYRFDDEGEFQIVDVPNDVVRPPETLSGGETFLASLALALAMAEAVSEQGGRLECFFLDEGFGALDPASLDLALDGIEELAVPGRLIGLISHVGGLQTRLDDLIVLEKEADGSTRVEQTEGPVSYLNPF